MQRTWRLHIFTLRLPQWASRDRENLRKSSETASAWHAKMCSSTWSHAARDRTGLRQVNHPLTACCQYQYGPSMPERPDLTTQSSHVTSRVIALYTTDTMADWEYAYLTTQVTTAESIRPGRFRLLLVGDGLEPVTSLGGLPITPSADLSELTTLAEEGRLAALVVPGGETYAQGHERLTAAVQELLERGVPVAAICGGTFLLARHGVLDTRSHTSNSKGYLETSGYRGERHYAQAPVVTDQGVTTASGIHAIPFTAEVMRVSGLVLTAVADAWERLYLTGDARHYEELEEVTRAWQDS